MREVKLAKLLKDCQEGKVECMTDAAVGKLVELRNCRTGKREMVRVVK